MLVPPLIAGQVTHAVLHFLQCVVSIHASSLHYAAGVALCLMASKLAWTLAPDQSLSIVVGEIAAPATWAQVITVEGQADSGQGSVMRVTVGATACLPFLFSMHPMH